MNNRVIAIDGKGKPITSIVELAREHGRSTGLVTDAKLTDPTSAAFYGHPVDPNDVDSIAAEFVAGGKIDIAMGGGAAQFSQNQRRKRPDGRDLLLELRRNGFDIVRTRAELEAVPAWRRPKLFGAFGNAELAFPNQLEERSEQPALSDMVRRAIELLQYNAGGYLLVVDAGLMRRPRRKTTAKNARRNGGIRPCGCDCATLRRAKIDNRYLR